jgi:hypothetical protein
MLCETHRRVNLAATSRREGTTASAAPSRSRSGRGDAGFGWGGAGTLPRVAEGEVREDLPDNRGIVQRGDQPEAASTMGTRQHVDAERPPRSAGSGGGQYRDGGTSGRPGQVTLHDRRDTASGRPVSLGLYGHPDRLDGPCLPRIRTRPDDRRFDAGVQVTTQACRTGKARSGGSQREPSAGCGRAA